MPPNDPTLYLCITCKTVPIEEIILFIITSWVSAQGIILLTDERSPGEIKKLKTLLLSLLRPSRTRR